MCRFILYHGPSIYLSSLITEPHNSLIHQSYKAQERAEPLNGDGFGVAWYALEHSSEPALFRSITPAWNNANLWSIARMVKSSCVLAHVRAASQQRSVCETNCHPFVSGRWSFMHNGDVGQFAAVRRPLLAELSDAAFQSIRGSTDSEHIFALFLDERARLGPELHVQEVTDVLRRTIDRLLRLVERHAPRAHCYLNLAVSDGRCSVTTRMSTNPERPPESLHLHRGLAYVCEGGVCRMLAPEADGGAVIVSSERLSEDPGWETVPPGHLLAVTPTGESSLHTM